MNAEWLYKTVTKRGIGLGIMAALLLLADSCRAPSDYEIAAFEAEADAQWLTRGPRSESLGFKDS